MRYLGAVIAGLVIETVFFFTKGLIAIPIADLIAKWGASPRPVYFLFLSMELGGDLFAAFIGGTIAGLTVRSREIATVLALGLLISGMFTCLIFGVPTALRPPVNWMHFVQILGPLPSALLGGAMALLLKRRRLSRMVGHGVTNPTAFVS